MDRFFTSYQQYPFDSIAELITLLPIAVGLFRLRFLEVNLKLLILLFFSYFVRDIISNTYAYAHHSNIFIYNIVPAIEVCLVGFIFYNTQVQSSAFRYALIIGMSLCFVLIGFFYNSTDFSNENYLIVRVYGLFVVLVFFHKMLSELRVKHILRYSMFWINSGLLLYFCGTFFVFLMSDKVLSVRTNSATFDQYWRMVLVFYMLLCTLSSVGIWFGRSDRENLT